MLSRGSVLIFTEWFEPGYKAGGPIRSIMNMIRELSGYFQFFVVTSDRDLGDRVPYRDVELNRWIEKENVRVYYTHDKLRSSFVRKIVHEVKPDVIYLNSMFSPLYTLLPLWTLSGMRYTGRIVVAPRGMLMSSALAHKSIKKKIFLSVFKRSGLVKKITFHATDEGEFQDILRVIGPSAAVKIANNLPSYSDEPVQKSKEPGELRIVYLSRIHPVKNLRFALEIFALVGSSFNIQFDVYGSIEDASYYRDCVSYGRRLIGKISMRFMGEVKHEKVPYILAGYHLFFLPTRGENYGHAIFEALSAGCPVLISDQTPWSDVQQHGAGWAYPLTQPEQFARVIEEVAGSTADRYNEISSSAFRYARFRMNVAETRNQYLEMFTQVQNS